MKSIRQIMIAMCAIMAIAAAAQQNDPVVYSIQQAYQQAKENIKNGKAMGNEMVSKLNYTVYGQGKTTETLHFFYKTVQGTFLMSDDRDPHFNYYPLYFVTRSYNIGKKKYYEEFLFDSESQRLLFALTQDYDENGKRFDRRFYYHEGSIYNVIGPEATPLMQDQVFYQAEELKHAFDWLLRNPKE